MPKFKVYAGLGGGFGGARYETTEEFESEEKAVDYAYECACQVYESYAGLHGLLDWDGVKEDLIVSGFYTEEEITDEIIEEAYNESREIWLDYYVKEVQEGDTEEDE
jgi:hypothetical protein